MISAHVLSDDTSFDNRHSSCHVHYSAHRLDKKRLETIPHLMYLFSYNISAPWNFAHGGLAADINLVIEMPKPQASSMLETFEYVCSLS